jgi:hypothetical protein
MCMWRGSNIYVQFQPFSVLAIFMYTQRKKERERGVNKTGSWKKVEKQNACVCHTAIYIVKLNEAHVRILSYSLFLIKRSDSRHIKDMFFFSKINNKKTLN